MINFDYRSDYQMSSIPRILLHRRPTGGWKKRTKPAENGREGGGGGGGKRREREEAQKKGVYSFLKYCDLKR